MDVVKFNCELRIDKSGLECCDVKQRWQDEVGVEKKEKQNPLGLTQLLVDVFNGIEGASSFFLDFKDRDRN